MSGVHLLYGVDNFIFIFCFQLCWVKLSKAAQWGIYFLALWSFYSVWFYLIICLHALCYRWKTVACWYIRSLLQKCITLKSKLNLEVQRSLRRVGFDKFQPSSLPLLLFIPHKWKWARVVKKKSQERALLIGCCSNFSSQCHFVFQAEPFVLQLISISTLNAHFSCRMSFSVIAAISIQTQSGIWLLQKL